MDEAADQNKSPLLSSNKEHPQTQQQQQQPPTSLEGGTRQDHDSNPEINPKIINQSAAMKGAHWKKKDDMSQTSNISVWMLFRKASKRAMGGGLPGLLAGIFQVLTLMWLRTIINYQCRYGSALKETCFTLYSEGGIPRFYQGLGWALIQAPTSRFVSTASNDGVNALLAGYNPAQTTLVASLVVGICRILLLPIDTCKTVLQIDGKEGFVQLMAKVRAGNLRVLYAGAVALAMSSALSHYPWFYTYNVLSQSELVADTIPSQLLRNAFVGVTASLVSDTTVNAFRVVKITKQALASKHNMSYGEVVRMIVAADGWKGLFGRGLKTRLLANAFQSLVFTVMWRGLAEHHWKK